MTLWADTATQKFQVTMKQNLSHTIELGSDPVATSPVWIMPWQPSRKIWSRTKASWKI